MKPELKQKIDALPESPGVYLMKDGRGRIFYIGKAKSLRDRVRSYFTGSDTRAFVARLDRSLASIEVVLTDNAKEALLLENQLIKEHQPRFNVRLTDDSNFLCLRLDAREQYPRIEVVRRFAKDGARYFGPYDSATSIRATLRLINRHFQLRTCSDQVMNNRVRPCLQFQIKRCPAPCVFDLGADGSYAANVARVAAFLDGRTEELLGELKLRMHAHSQAMQYEAAARVRDQIRAIEHSAERQRIITPDFVNRDVVGIYREGPAVEIHVMRTRDGRLIDARRFSFAEQDAPTGEVLSDFAMGYYSEQQQMQQMPDEILLPPEMEWHEPLAAILSEARGRAVAVLVPQRGDKKRLCELAARNAQQAFVDQRRQAGAARDAVEKLQRALRLAARPESIECFDISHLQGSHIVASCVRFDLGVANKAMYRRYKIRSTQDQDDFQSMYEVVSRRARRGLEEGDLPALLVVDGGKGQLGAARAALNDHGIDHVDLVGLAKARVVAENHARGKSGSSSSSTPERVFVEGQKNAIVLRQDSAELFLLTRARDEAHRFAITFQRQQRRRAATQSVLDDIPGVGPARRRQLLRHFGSVKQIRAATETRLAQVVGPKLAAVVHAALREGVGEGHRDDGDRDDG